MQNISSTFVKAISLLLFCPVEFDDAVPSRSTLVTLFIAAVLATLLAQFAQAYGYVYWYYFGVTSQVASWAVLFTAAFLIGFNAGPGKFLTAAGQLLAVSTIMNLLIAASATAVQPYKEQITGLEDYGVWLLALLSAPFVAWQAIALYRLGKALWVGEVRLAGLKLICASAISVLIVPMYPGFYGTYDYRSFVDLWTNYQRYTAANETRQASSTSEQSTPTEKVVYAQNRMIETELSKIQKSGASDSPHYYFISMAPDDVHLVFEREAQAVRAIADDILQTRNRSIALINSTKTMDKLPLASVTSLSLTLEGMKKAMHAERDVLVLYITSHGSTDYIPTSMSGLSLDPLIASSLKSTLDNSGIKNMVVIISACYSGSFIDDLQGPNRIVMTAASATRTSFGCSDDRDWTFFGEALFNRGLKETDSLLKAFDKAKLLVSQWETEQKMTASEPQISVGANIEKLLPPVTKKNYAAK